MHSNVTIVAPSERDKIVCKYPDDMNILGVKNASRRAALGFLALVSVSIMLLSGQANAANSMTSTLTNTSVSAGAKVVLTTELPASTATSLIDQEIIQDID